VNLATFWLTEQVRCTVDKYIINILMIMILLIVLIL